MIAGDLIGERSRLTPNKTALVDVATGARLSYADLSGRASRMALAIRGACGAEKGDRVGILCHNRVEFLDAFFASGKSGVVLVPLGTRLTAAELATIVEDAEIRGLIYESAFDEVVAELRSLTSFGRGMRLGEGDVVQPAADVDLLAALEAADPDCWENVSCLGEDLYCLLYTSGTTGRPKGVMTPHRQILWNGFNTAACWQLREEDVSPIFTPLYHAGGLGAFLVPIVAIGGTLVLHRGFDPGEIWRTVEGEGATVVLGVPTIYRLLMEAPEFPSVDLSSVRWLISGGAPLPTSIIEAYQRRGVGFKQGFGMTEVGVNCFAMTLEDSERKAGSIGKPLMFTEARIADEDDRSLPHGEIGELQFRGPHVCLGYWNNPEATAAAFTDDGFFRTGDLARCDEEGFFYIAGRRKDMFISGGVNIYPAEVEAEIVRHPAVREAALVGVPSETWGEVGVAFVVLVEGGELDDGALVAFLEKRLARYKIPRKTLFVDALPRTPYGKVVKAELIAKLEGKIPDAERG